MPIRKFLKGHKVETTSQRDRDTLKNDELLNAAENAGFEILITPDKNIRCQQNLAGRKIALVVLGNSQWPKLPKYVDRIVKAVEASIPGSYVEVGIPED